MDYLTVVNLTWFIVFAIAVLVNWRHGYRQGVVDSYTNTTVPIVDMLMAQGYISAKQSGSEDPVDASMLTQHLLRMAMLREQSKDTRG